MRDGAPNRFGDDGEGLRLKHFAERVDEKRRLLRFVCEGQPLITLTCYDLPKRCPLCSQSHPIPIVKTKGERE
jgi:hypothetical protein